MRLEDSEKLLRLIFPNYQPGTRAIPRPVWNRLAKTAQIGAFSHVSHHC
jgi:hypothetical protein